MFFFNDKDIFRLANIMLLTDKDILRLANTMLLTDKDTGIQEKFNNDECKSSMYFIIESS